jgi:hypothetical protein
MKGLCWEDFRSQAEVSICRDCEYGHGRAWRGNTTCLQTWLRFHSSRGIILACNASFARRGPARLEDGLMSEGGRPQEIRSRIA